MNKIKHLFLHLYYEEERYIKKILGITIIIGIFCLIKYFNNNDLNNFIYLLYWILLVFGLSSIYYIVKILFLYEWHLEYQSELTKELCIEYLPKIMKIFGLTSVGKDTFCSFFAKTIRNHIKEKYEMEYIHISNILYMIDFKKLNEEIIKNKNKLKLSDRTLFNENCKSFLIDNNCFKFNKYIDFDLMNNYLQISFKKISYFKKLIEYVRLYVRVNLYDNYILSNQPYLEEEKTAKVFSNDYLKIKHLKVEKKKKNQIEVEEEKIKFPLIEGSIVIETEADAWWNNLDPDVKKYLENSGIRHTKAFNRHLFGTDYYHIQVGQVQDRVNKQLRELDHGFIHIIQTEKIYAKPKKINRYENKISKFENRIYRLNNKIDKKSTKRRIKKLDKIKRKISKKIINLEKIKENLYLKQFIYVTRTGAQETFDEISLMRLLKKENYTANFKTHIYFKASDSWPNYNDKYLEAIANDLFSKNTVDFNDLENWNKELILNKNEAYLMNYPVLNDLFKLDKKILYENNYIKYVEDEIE